MASFNSYNFSGKKAIVRVDFNVPIKEGKITDDTRIRAALPTLRKILKDGGSIILVSHWGRPIKDMAKKPALTKADFSLKRIVNAVAQALDTEVIFVEDFQSESGAQALEHLQAGQVALLENIRFHPGEEKGDTVLAASLASLGEVYVNDAFGTAHRAHASTAIMAQHFGADDRMAGLLMQAEIDAGNKVLNQAEKPFTAIIGGAKVSDKIMIIENLLERATDIIIGGGMAYTFFRAQGGNIGASLCEEDRLDTAKALLEKAKAKGVNIHLPKDSIAADKFAADAAVQATPSDEIPEGWMGLDIGPKAAEEFANVVLQSKTVLWNGPMGVFEMEKFQAGTKAIAEAVKDATAKGAFTLIGGGDSVAAINKFGYADQVSYVSTGGGAMLEFFEGKSLPGIAAIQK